MFEAVFLDFYGTLVHEDDVNIERIVHVLHAAARSGTAMEDIDRYWYERFFHWCAVSNSAAYVPQRTLAISALRETMDAFDISLDPEEVIAPQLAHWRQPPLFDDTVPFLTALAEAKIPVWVVSNVDREDILDAIAFHGLPLGRVLTSEDARSYKPHPAIFELALERAGVARARVLHIGDSRTSDVTGAINAGIPVAWLNRTGKSRHESPASDFEIESLLDVMPIIGC